MTMKDLDDYIYIKSGMGAFISTNSHFYEVEEMYETEEGMEKLKEISELELKPCSIEIQGDGSLIFTVDYE